MTIKRQTPGECEWKLSIFRDGERLQSDDASFQLTQFCVGWKIVEDITLATMEAEFIFTDGAGISAIFTGSETFKLEVFTSIADRTYYFRSVNIQNRVRGRSNSETFSIHAMSAEFMKNETVNVFGSSDVIFDGKTKSEEIITSLMTNFLGTSKRVFTEETVSNQSFIIPNWRPLDTAYWVAQRSIRKSTRGNELQNGFMFYENSLGYNFKSIDGMIDDINKQDDRLTDESTDRKKLYQYSYAPKAINEELDHLTLEGVSFPEEAQKIRALRNGTMAGYSVGFDPVDISESAMGLSSDVSRSAYEYNITDSWDKMSHLDPAITVNPITQMDQTVQSEYATPKRIRYCMLPSQGFDPKYKDSPQSNYKELVELQAYQYMRYETLKHIKCLTSMSGNLDLYAGGGIDISLPATYNTTGDAETDRRYSGRYLIVRLTHSATTGKLNTEVELMKDSILK
jgi:hypothetical protein